MVGVVPILLIRKEVIMPSGDRTGPFGQGSGTGRGFGNCLSNNFDRFRFFGQNKRNFFGLGAGRRIRGRFNFNDYYINDSERASEKEFLEEDIKNLKSRLSFLERKLLGLKRED